MGAMWPSASSSMVRGIRFMALILLASKLNTALYQLRLGKSWEVKGLKIAPNETSFTQFHRINLRSGCSFERDLEDYNLFMVFTGLYAKNIFCEFVMVQMILALEIKI